MVTEVWVGQFSIVGGEAREQGPWIGMHPARSNILRTDLYVVVEPALPGSEELCPSLVEVIGRLFRVQRLSLTGALLASLKAAHERLQDWNQKSLREHQVVPARAAWPCGERRPTSLRPGPPWPTIERRDRPFGSPPRTRPPSPSAPPPSSIPSSLAMTWPQAMPCF